MPGHRTDAHSTVVVGHVPERVSQRIDVDHVLGGGQPQLHHRQQAVTAGEQPGLRTELFEQRKRVLHTRGAFVPERCWDLQDWTSIALLVRRLPVLWSRCQPHLSDHLFDARTTSVIRPRRPPRVREGRGGGAGGDRARGIGGRGRAAQGARGRAVRAQRPRDRADAGRAAARGAGVGDPRAGRAGAPLGGRERRVAAAARAGHAARRRAHRAAGRALHGARRRPGGRGLLRRRVELRRGAGAPAHRHRAGAVAGLGVDVASARRFCAAADPRGRADAPAGRRARDRPERAGRCRVARRPAGARPRRGHRRLPRPPRAHARDLDVLERRRGHRRGGRRRGRDAGALALGRRRGPPPRAGPPRRARHAGGGDVARVDARAGPRAAGRAGAAALRHHARGHPGDLTPAARAPSAARGRRPHVTLWAGAQRPSGSSAR